MFALSPSPAQAATDDPVVTQADRSPQNWPTNGRTYDEQHYSPLSQINKDTIGRLKLAWFSDFDTNRGQEGTPLVVDGILYATTNWSKVRAYDAATGRLLWSYDPEVPGASAVRGCCDTVNRGAAYWNGKIFVGTFDNRLVALDAKTGRKVWDVQTIPKDSWLGDIRSYVTDGAPRVAKGVVMIGNGGAEFGARGFISGFDAETGALKWRFFTTPNRANQPDHAASDTPLTTMAYQSWGPNGAWTHSGGGGTVWDAIVYDPRTDLVYVGVGNGSPWNYKQRSDGVGDNLFLGSIVAIRPETGEYVWHFQETPQDQWDYTSTQPIMTTDLEIGGRMRHVLLHAPKNGFFYILDAKTGQFLSAKPYVPVNWARSVDPLTGRPDIVPDALYSVTGKPWAGLPGDLGGHNFAAMSYSARTGLVYIPAQQIPMMYVPDPQPLKQKGLNLGISMQGLPDDPAVRDGFIKTLKGWLIAWDPKQQKEIFRVDHGGPWNGGLLATGGDLVFQGLANGVFHAYDATNGADLFRFNAQSGIIAPPISYQVNGRQYIAVEAGWGGIYPLLLGRTALSSGWTVNHSRLLVFALDGTARLPAQNDKGFLPVQPPSHVDTRQAGAGYELYENFCQACHGDNAQSGGVLPDLRWSGALRDRTAFYNVVGRGALTAYGMTRFDDILPRRDIEAIRQFLIKRAQDTYPREVAARSNPQGIPQGHAITE
ncbi:PQQ-dependent dehydrogenase, methanol/ethanol family [Gluconacetobacter sacchari]|nr:PQQ-dependent dehydrogenase, methanol/ethanol family [Gluconacetobacter sacchari]